jgi:superfamily II DNA helicase RecQ
VYVRQQRDADRVRDFLSSQGHAVVAYHAGMDTQQRANAQVSQAVSRMCMREAAACESPQAVHA